MLNRTAYDQRRSGLVNKYAVYLIHNSVIVPPLDKFVDIILHIVSQVVKPEFVVGPVSYVAFICQLPFRVIHPMNNDTY